MTRYPFGVLLEESKEYPYPRRTSTSKKRTSRPVETMMRSDGLLLSLGAVHVAVQAMGRLQQETRVDSKKHTTNSLDSRLGTNIASIPMTIRELH